MDNYQDFFDKLHSSDGPRNLRQIFEDDDKPLQTESSSLRYQPQQQQPKYKSKMKALAHRSKQDTVPVENWNTVVAKVAQGYNGSENVGRVGVALSRNGNGAAKLVVYKSRTQLLTTLLLTKSTQSSTPRTGPTNVILRESYMQFYDDEKRFWSLRFEQPKDEEEFTDALIKLGLPIEVMRSEQAGKPSTVGTPPASTLPQPLPRHQIATASKPEPTDSESESTQSTEDTTSTRGACSLNSVVTPMPPSSSSSTVSLTTTPQNMSSESPSSKIEIYVEQQRTSTEKKTEAILQAMRRLAGCGNVPYNDGGDSIAINAEHHETSKIETLLKAISRLAGNSTMNQFNDSVDTGRSPTDNEDELLELEQKLLDVKKENRVLMKSLRAKEQALADLRASMCALCDELLAQNNELKLQNTALISAMSSQNNATVACSNADISCGNCEQYLARINVLERHLLALQNALLNGLGTGGTRLTATPSNGSASISSPP